MTTERIKHLFTKVVGVTYENDDGTSRQAILGKCGVLEGLHLQHDKNNPHDKNAVRVLRENGEQLGFLERNVAEDVVRDGERGYQYTLLITDLIEAEGNRHADIVLVWMGPGVSKGQASTYLKQVLEEKGFDDVEPASGKKPGGCLGVVALGLLLGVCAVIVLA